jgi:hypothetical protein
MNSSKIYSSIKSFLHDELYGPNLAEKSEDFIKQKIKEIVYPNSKPVSLYEKCIEGLWYNPTSKKTVGVYVVTYEEKRTPNREEELIEELRADFPDAGDLAYDDGESVPFNKRLPIYPDLEIGELYDE